MGGMRKRKVPAGEAREVLAQNVGRMMETRYEQASNRPLALAKDAGVTLSTVQRVLSREHATNVDTIEALAKVFGLPPFQLLVPWGMLGHVGINPAAPGTGQRAPLFRGRVVAKQRSGIDAFVRHRRRA